MVYLDLADSKSTTRGLAAGGAPLPLDAEQVLGWQLEGSVGSIPVGNWQGSARTSLGAGESSLTWQAFAGVGYTFGWGDVTVAWRHLAYEAKSGESVEEVDFDGPAIAASIRW